jgi:hypothetical protein
MKATRETKRQLARLEKLAVLVESVKPEAYNHDSYGNGKCGTACCALGHAAVNKSLFPGLRLTFNPNPEYPWTVFNEGNEGGITPITDKYFGKGAYDAIFDPDAHEEATDYVEGVTPAIVAEAIRQFADELEHRP